MMRPAILAVLSASVVCAAASARILHVDAGGGGDFTSIADAVEDAEDGDIVLVADGVYFEGGIVVDGKAITVQGERDATVRVESVLVVRNLPAGEEFTARNLDVDFPSGGEPLLVEDCAGQVRFEDCDFESLAVDVSNAGRPGATVRFCDAVAFNNCRFVGAVGGLGFDDFPGPVVPPGRGGNGCFVRVSNVTFTDSTLTGGRSGSIRDGGFTGANGGHGLEAVASEVLVSGCLLTGGNGSSGNCDDDVIVAFCGDGGDGGNGLLARGTAAGIQLLTTGLVPGAAGAGGQSFCCPWDNGDPGDPGQMLVLEDGAALVEFSAAARGFHVSSPTREGEVIDVLFDGIPGDEVFAWLSVVADYAPLPSRQGVFLLGFPLLLPAGLPLGVADGEGHVLLDIPLGDLGPGIEGVVVFVQTVFRDVETGDVLLGPASTAVLLDAAR